MWEASALYFKANHGLEVGEAATEANNYLDYAITH